MARIQNNAAQTIKLLSLLIICYGHIFMILIDGKTPDFFMGKWWALGDIGIFYLSMSSAYYTALHYNAQQSMAHYWSRKVNRIGIQFLFINVLLFCYFLIQGKMGIFTLHSLVNLLGLNGFLNWFHIHDVSPFGAGQWFITILLIFYFIYPVINRCFRSRSAITFLFVITALAAATSEYFIHYGHSLWSTSFGFVAGFYLCRNTPRQRTSLLYALFLMLILIVLRLLCGSLSVITYSFIATMAFCLGLLTLSKDIPWLAFNYLVRPLDAIFLPLFLIHTYFFKYTFVDQPHINALIILTCNILLAKMITIAYSRFQKILFP